MSVWMRGLYDKLEKQVKGVFYKPQVRQIRIRREFPAPKSSYWKSSVEAIKGLAVDLDDDRQYKRTRMARLWSYC